MSRDILILWRANEAHECFGKKINRSIGSQMKSIIKGDRLFITATEHNELFLLGVIDVDRLYTVKDNELIKKYGKYGVSGQSVFGKFKMIPLESVKWKLRFESKNDRLKQKVTIGYQLQMHRFLTSESSELLLNILNKSKEKLFSKVNDFINSNMLSKQEFDFLMLLSDKGDEGLSSTEAAIIFDLKDQVRSNAIIANIGRKYLKFREMNLPKGLQYYLIVTDPKRNYRQDSYYQ